MKILLVDDEPHVTRAIQQLVNWDELSIDTVLTASSGHDALEQMELYVPEILMTDVVMPDMTGLDLIKTVHANYPHTKILMISGYSDFVKAPDSRRFDLCHSESKRCLGKRGLRTQHQTS